MFDSVLVANRGEIAVRIIRTLHDLGIRSVTVFSDADRNARHVADADVAVHIGPAPAAQSYLDVERIMNAAQDTGAQALHPGYGFLSENPVLAAACAEAGIAFVGPGATAIELMGDKIRAKETVAAHGVRVVPGVSGDGLGTEELVDAARQVGFPLLIKPSAGGGGKGMRLVQGDDALADEIRSARREAAVAFGDDTLLIERYVEASRHIEVQVLADTHGNIVHLGERECSLQRRHQKVIEEAPSPYLSDEHRSMLCEQAIAAARACDYVNAGTVEFIVSGTRADDAFFLEMNTRLQVEHPVTEEVWGVDLVEQQLRIAAGETLSVRQDDLVPRGHSFEARVYAEDPSQGFLPTGGTVEALHEPTDRGHIRVDSSLATGTRIGTDYDPMLSKIISWGPDRDTARRRLDAALAATAVHGVTTNVGFLRTVLADTSVAAGVMDTGLVERIAAEAPPESTSNQAAVVAALALLDTSTGSGAWGERGGWRLGPPAWITQRLTDATGTPIEVDLRFDPDGTTARIDGREWAIERDRTAGEMRLVLDGNTLRPTTVVSDAAVSVVVDGDEHRFDREAGHDRDAVGADGGLTLTSPMPGTIIAVPVAVGDTVAAGDPIVVLEAMKMEHTLRAASDAVVAELLVQPGAQVERHETVAVLAPVATEADL